MNYVKKMCILRQIKQGFSGDGKALSGLIKIEQYGKNLAVEVSIINFAPLVSGEYYCLLSDGKGKTEMLSLRGKSFFNILSDIDVSNGFCGIICYVKNDVVPVAYGINGNGSYDWRAILNATLPPVFPKSEDKGAHTAVTTASKSEELPPPKLENEAPMSALNENTSTAATRKEEEPASAYDDDRVAAENYYEEEDDERERTEKTVENARTQSPATESGAQKRADPAENGDAESVLHPFKTDSDGYYRSVKGEIDDLFKTYPRDKTLCGAFSCSEWVRIKGTAKDP